jgi:lipopolysaccharide export system protein LptC
MRLRKWFAREVLALIVMVIVASFIATLQDSYGQISYADMLSMFKDNKISEINYNESGKVARVLDETEGKYYQVGIISGERFEDEVYDYSLKKSNLKYSS